jgi:phospholipase C
LGFNYKGDPNPLGSDKFTLPPQSIPTIADALSAHGVSWKWYSGGRQTGDTAPSNEYCGICDPLTGFTAIMTTPLKDNLQGVEQFYQDVTTNDALPAVSFIRPFESKAGHPANATVPDFENFVVDVVNRVKQNQDAWSKTVILVTTDEGGGYYDSGYVQPIDFFGDGTRIPLLAVSPLVKKGFVDHTYYDHASILKFIEKNWGLTPLSKRSRDNLPNPIAGNANPYIPINRPAIGDLMNLFDFEHGHDMARADK